MKILKSFLIISVIITAFLGLSSCKSKEGGNATFKYAQFASGGTKTMLDATILFENANSTFTKYQVAYTSCTCRGPETNYRSVMYIELLNTKPTKDEASIRRICFDKLDNAVVGMWGDSNPVYGKPDYTAEYMNDNFVQKLVGKTKKDFDSWGGYGKQDSGIQADAVTGATVSTGNITSVIKELFKYHTDKYYK